VADEAQQSGCKPYWAQVSKNPALPRMASGGAGMTGLPLISAIGDRLDRSFLFPNRLYLSENVIESLVTATPRTWWKTPITSSYQAQASTRAPWLGRLDSRV